MLYVFDLDGTLCNTKGSNYLEATPYIDRIKKVNKLYDEGHTIIIETARGCISGKKWLYQTIDQLKSWGLRFHTVRTGVKFMADVYVDDRGIDAKDFFSNDNKNFGIESGSGVNTKIIIVNRVIKEATNESAKKLTDEINFIEKLPKKFKSHFPQIMFYKNTTNKTIYEMEHYNLPSIRKLILNNRITATELLYWTEKITKFSLELYNHEKLNTVSENEFFDVLHWNRFTSRIDELKRKSSWFKDILKKKEIEINSEKYKNLPTLFPILKSMQNSFKPEFIGRWSHSDLHYSNILIDKGNDEFKLIDPRGYAFCDYYYDFGKLWHSVNGKYELIAAGQYTVSKIGEDHTFYLDSSLPAYKLLDGIKDELLLLLKEYSNDDYYTMVKKIRFNEVMHFSTLIPFLLVYDDEESKARAAYYQSVILMNKFFNYL